MWSHLTADASLPLASEVREFRTWARRAWWACHRTPGQKARALLDLMLTPGRVTVEMVRVYRSHVAFASTQFGIPWHRQLRQLVHARIRHGLDPIAYYRFQLYRPEHWTRAGQFVQTADTRRVFQWLVASTPGYPRVFGDKRAFEAWCAEHGLPAVATIMEFDGGRLVCTGSDGSLPASDLFSKPANWQGGQGALTWRHDGRRGWVGPDGVTRDARALIAELAQLSSDLGRPVLLQPWLRNAASVADLTAGGLCTARIATLKSPGGEVQLLHAVYRMPADGAAADNFYLGGLAAPVDLRTGRLGRAIRKDRRLMPAPAARHPTTGAAIEGRHLPRWADAVSLVLRAHAAIAWDGVPCVGWDVAFVDDGPLLVEGNNVPCSTFAQMVTGVPLGDTPLLACLNAHLRTRFGSGA